MRSFGFGVVVGAIAMYFYMQGFGPLVSIAQGWWSDLSAPQRNALQQ
jgi:hypothetical protein